jgi:hypothetical protein
VTDLAITARCLADLQDLPLAAAEHILLTFYERRGENADGGEEMKGLGGPLRKLHADMAGGQSLRAVTWHDLGRGVCWLLAAGHHDVYQRVAALARTDAHWPSTTDLANFEADAPIRLMERVVRQAKAALDAAVAQRGVEVPLTQVPPPVAFFRVDQDRLWLRIALYGREGFQLTPRQLAVLVVNVFGEFVPHATPDDVRWDSVYFVGPIPDSDAWPPPRRQLPE